MHERTFTLGDQSTFARLSGDHNPMHVDPLAARRLLYGRPVVHGIHCVLWALNLWLEKQPGQVSLRFIKVSFLRPVKVDEQVQCSVISEKDRKVRLELTSGGLVTTRILFEWASAPLGGSQPIVLRTPEERPPRDLARDAIEAAAGALDLSLDLELALRCFPEVMRGLGPLPVAVLAGSSRLVGMECPGLNSIFSELSLSADAAGDAPPQLRYEVTEFSGHYGLVRMRVTAPGLAGTIQALVRPPPQPQATFATLSQLVGGQEFTGQRALVVGGSRGLGEVTAKLLCAGGAHVHLTYHLGQAEAARVIADITAHGGVARCSQRNVLALENHPTLEAGEAGTPTHLYYFATPAITPGLAQQFSSDLFRLFCDYYVAGFARTAEHFLRLGVKNFYYASTVHVEEPPPNLAEYAAAKMAGENVCRFLEKNHPGLQIARPRLPKMATDQTASLIPAGTPEPGPILLASLRAYHGATRGPG